MAAIITAANALTWPGAIAIAALALAGAVCIVAVCWMYANIFG